MLEAEVKKSKLSSISSSERCVGSFEKHTRGIGSKLMFKMSCEGKVLGKHAQGMIDPILVEERPKKFDLGHFQSNGEKFKAMKACETTSRINFVTSSRPQSDRKSVV